MVKHYAFVTIALFLLSFALPINAQENPANAGAAQEQPAKPKSTRAKMLMGQPVNTQIAGAGTLPEGKALTIINASFADKTSSERGYKGSDVFSQTWLLKLRYGITNHLEFLITTPYINNKRHNPSPASGPTHIEGLSDIVVGLSLAPYNFHQGDPIALSFYAGLITPTGMWGKNHLPGVGVWGGRVAAGIATYFTEDVRGDTEVVYSAPFDRGNQRVKRGGQFQWNSQLRYLFDNFDIGVESVLTYQESGDKRTAAGKSSMRNGYTEWLVGPAIDIPIDPLNMWAGFGVYFPVVQEFRGPAAVENVRFDFKLAKLW